MSDNGRELSRFFDIPYDAAVKSSRITAVDGRTILAENCGALMQYDSDCIRFEGRNGSVSITGAELAIKLMRRDEVIISGLIASVEWG